VKKIALYLGAGGGGVAFLTLAKDAIAEWLGLSTRNKVKARVGTTSIEVTGTRDLEAAIALAMNAGDGQRRTRRIARGSRLVEQL
jgi:hypothetical protein